MGKLKRVLVQMEEEGLEYPIDINVIMKEVENA